ncbi:MAG TPA: hypothetical protein VKR58_13465 [Aquella sp.]|nr:hypothetical protein [Aquella sp.]
MSKSKTRNETEQIKDSFLEKIIASTPVNTYWNNLDGDNQVYNDVAAIQDAETLRINPQAEKLQDFNKCLSSIQNIIQSYTIGTLDYKTPLNSEFNTLSDEIVLTKRESEILYYLSLNKSIKDIAAVITILDNKPVSASAINTIIDKQLYPKFEVDNIEKLIEKANSLKLILFQLDN